MKRFALITISLSVALAQLSFAEDNNNQNAPVQKHARPARPTTRTAPAHINGSRGNLPNTALRGQFHPQRNFTPNQNTQRRVYTPRVTTSNAAQTNTTVRQANENPTRFNGNGWRGQANGNQNWHRNNGNQQRTNNIGQNREVNRSYARNRNWDRSRHDRSWYRSHYSRFARFSGGYYYWDAGFWYPAYGYDPYFSSYAYNAPVVAYNDLDPGQVIANVQAQLQRDGYYRGELDGLFGPMTRQALLNFQSDNGLEPTGEIDQTTLDSLGLQ